MSHVKPGWQVWEEEMASRIGGELVKASGRLTGYKGDVKTSDILVDCKYTATARYALSAKMWRSVSDWAMNEMRVPMIAVRLGNGREVGIMRNRDFHDVIARNGGTVDGQPTSDTRIRLSFGISVKTELPVVVWMADGAWSEEIVAMPLDDMLKVVGIDED